MNKLKNLLQYDGGKYIHVVIIVTLYILSYHSYLAILLLLAEVFFVFKKSKNIVIYALVIILIITVKIQIRNNRNITLPFTGVVTEVNDNYFYLKSDFKVICYYDYTENLEPGMVVEVSGVVPNIKQKQIMNTFDYITYLKSSDISGIIYANSVKLESKAFSLHQIKYQIVKMFDKKYSQETASFLKLFLLGEKDDIYLENQEMISTLGISHLFAISGMHLALLVTMISFLLKKLYISKEKECMVITIFLIAYNIITCFKLSIMRATLLIIGVYLKDYLKIVLSKVDILSFAYLGMLIYNPYFLYNIGFELSYLIAFSLLLGSDIYNKDAYIKKIIKITIFASLLSLPITVQLNHSFGLVFIFSNLFFILFVSYLCLPFSVILVVFPLLEPIYLRLIWIYNFALEFFNQINIQLKIGFTQTIYVLMYWIFILIFIINKNNVKRKVIALLMIVVTLFLSTLLPFKSNYFVRFLDVGQGDAIHIHNGDFDMLIDTGDIDKYDTLVTYFDAYNIEEIDVILITHFHQDHYGEINDIIKNFKVNKVYINTQSDKIESVYEVLNAGDTFSYKNSHFQVLSANTSSENENNNTIVLYAVIANQKYLFTGDIEMEIESIINENFLYDIDILKIPHHGSSTSSTSAFIENAKAEIGIISVGEDNDYSLPSSEVLERYASANCLVYRTDLNGTITFYYYPVINIRITETYKLHKRAIYHLDYI